MRLEACHTHGWHDSLICDLSPIRVLPPSYVTWLNPIIRDVTQPNHRWFIMYMSIYVNIYIYIYMYMSEYVNIYNYIRVLSPSYVTGLNSIIRDVTQHNHRWFIMYMSIYFQYIYIYICTCLSTWIYIIIYGFCLPHMWRDSTRSYAIYHVQPIAFGVSFLQSHLSIEDVVLKVSFATFRWKETKEIEIGDWVEVTLQMQ